MKLQFHTPHWRAHVAVGTATIALLLSSCTNVGPKRTPAIRECPLVTVQIENIELGRARRVQPTRWQVPVKVTVRNGTERDLQVLLPWIEGAIHSCELTDSQGTKWHFPLADTHLMVMAESRDDMPSRLVRRGETREMAVELLLETPSLRVVNAHLVPTPKQLEGEHEIAYEGYGTILVANAMRTRYYYVDCYLLGTVAITPCNLEGVDPAH